MADDAFQYNHARYVQARPEAMPPFGPNALALVAYLLERPDTLAGACEATGVRYQTAAAAIHALCAQGLATVIATGAHNCKTYAVAEAWRDRLEEVVPHMTTHGLLLRRKLANAEARLVYLRGRKGVAPERFARAAAEYDRLSAVHGAGSFVRTVAARPRPDLGPVPHRDTLTDEQIEAMLAAVPTQQVEMRPSDFVRATRPQHVWLRHDAEEQANQAERDPLRPLMAQMQQLRLEGLDGPEVERLLHLAGWEPGEMAEAWSRVLRGDWPEGRAARLRQRQMVRPERLHPTTRKELREMAAHLRPVAEAA